MAPAQLKIRFETPEVLQAEFDKNIANGGVFIPCDGQFELRAAIDVEIEFAFGPNGPDSIVLRGEIVHQVPAEMAGAGAVPGVAIQFEASAGALRDHFLPYLTPQRAAMPVDVDLESARRRSSRRNPVRVPVRVMPMSSAPFEVTSRDLSASGILLSLGSEELPVGELVCVCIWHPNGESSVEIDGQVMREVRNQSGRIAAVAVAFDRRQAADPQVAKVISALRRAGQRSQLGGIQGSISELGVASLLQMFCSSSPRGTLVVEQDGEQGFVAFEDSQLLAAELGAERGIDALVSLLDWGEGRFQFEATVVEALLANQERVPLMGALLEATRIADERNGTSASDEYDENEFTFGTSSEAPATFDTAEPLAPEADPEPPPSDANAQTTVMETPFLHDEESAGAPPVWRPEMVFSVNTDREAAVRSGLGKVEEAVLDLAKAGMSLQKMLDIIPETPHRIQSALEILIDLSVLRAR